MLFPDKCQKTMQVVLIPLIDFHDHDPKYFNNVFLAADKGNLLWDEINTIVTIFYAYENLERHLQHKNGDTKHFNL